MNTTELEKTYLAKYLPPDLEKCESKIISDLFIPITSGHPHLRVRQNGDKYEITKKYPITTGDASIQVEETIPLAPDEYQALAATEGNRFTKKRYLYPYQGLTAEIDVYQGSLAGLVVIDFEFDNEKTKDAFQMPDFCLAEVTQETFLAGGKLGGKSYSDLEARLKKLGYTAILA